MAINCKFGDYLNKTLRNQFVFGLRAERIQSRLLEVRDLTSQQAMDIALGMEISSRDAAQLHKSTHNVNSLQKGHERKNNTHFTHKNTHFTRTDTPNTHTNNTFGTNKIYCFRCGGNHKANVCKLDKNITCKKCNLKGHLQRVCMKNKNKRYTNLVEEEGQDQHNLDEILLVDTKEPEHTEFRKKYRLQVEVEGKPISFEVDGGSPVTLLSKTLHDTHFSNVQIHSTTLELVSYCKMPIDLVGYISVRVKMREITKKLNMYITSIDRSPLLGREWIRQLPLHYDLHDIQVGSKIKLDKILQDYKDIFAPGFGKIQNIQAKFTLKPNSKPVFLKARTVPFKLIPLVEKEINNLVKEGILEKVNTSEWATPVVPI